jgi:hypothetical protein
MIDTTSLSSEWIAGKRNKYRKDPGLMESMIFALYLLERLKISGLEFCFKGGTSLLLLMPEPRRFSVDIDIVVSPQTDRAQLEAYLAKVIETGTFIRLELDDRRSYRGNTPKAHYRFIYISNFSNKNLQGETVYSPEREILLDILFAENHYPVLTEKTLNTEWLKQDTPPVTLTVPDVNSIAGDKLTAFAPNTTGILYGAGKEKEIVKQLFDVGCLFDLLTDIEVFKKSFMMMVQKEIGYRSERKIETPQQVLHDIINTALLIARKDILKDEDEKTKFNEISTGISQFRHFVFTGKFEILEAQVAAAKAACLAALILTDYKGILRIFDAKIPLTDYMITHPDYNFLNRRLKFTARGEALFYWSQTVEILFPDYGKTIKTNE